LVTGFPNYKVCFYLSFDPKFLRQTLISRIEKNTITYVAIVRYINSGEISHQIAIRARLITIMTHKIANHEKKFLNVLEFILFRIK